MKKSESIAKITEALSKAQGQFNIAVKDSTNPHFKSKYADLASCIDATRKALSDNNLAVSQFPTMITMGDKHLILVTTILSHSSGEYFESEIMIPLAQLTPQSVGSSITYARRYALAAILQISQEDDDANSAQPLNTVVSDKKLPVKSHAEQYFDSTSLAHQKALKVKLELHGLSDQYGELLLKLDKKLLSEIEPILKILKGEKSV